MKSRRYFALDGIRGLALLNMTAYHAVWDLVYLSNFHLQWYQSEGAYIWQQCICWTFIAQHPEKCSSGAFCRIFLSGFCEPLGKEKLKRGITVFSLGFLIVAATLITMPQNRVRFGVLTLIGSFRKVLTKSYASAAQHVKKHLLFLHLFPQVLS